MTFLNNGHNGLFDKIFYRIDNQNNLLKYNNNNFILFYDF